MDKWLEPGTHEAELEWDLMGVATFGSQTVQLGFFFNDLVDRGFFENYGPSGFEYDSYPTTLRLKLVGTRTPHKLYINGVSQLLGYHHWQVKFPSHFTPSSYYFHLTSDAKFHEQVFRHALEEKDITVQVYSAQQDLLNEAVRQTPRILSELEQTYGGYAHDSLVIFVTPGGGGMEYSGATMTGLGALGHELTHSWFARGVMPASGNSGWIDEAIASWRDSGYPQKSSPPGYQNLAAFSPYRRHTPRLAYSGGRDVIAYLDRKLSAQGGMRALLKKLFLTYRHQTITTPLFEAFVENQTGEDLGPLFDTSVYSKRKTKILPIATGHPVPYDEKQMRELQ